MLGKITFAGQIVAPQANAGKHAEKAGRIVQRSALDPVIHDNVNIAISRSYVDVPVIRGGNPGNCGIHPCRSRQVRADLTSPVAAVRLTSE
jgi:hypothetical protein